MNSKQIEQYLGFLGQKLAEMQAQATILILGDCKFIYTTNATHYEVSIYRTGYMQTRFPCQSRVDQPARVLPRGTLVFRFTTGATGTVALKHT